MLNEANKSRYYSNELLHSISNKLYSIKKKTPKLPQIWTVATFLYPKYENTTGDLSGER
jgi:hypothetical protein